VSVSFKQSKHALNFDSNDHQKKTKKTNKTVLKQQKQRKNMFFVYISRRSRKFLGRLSMRVCCWPLQIPYSPHVITPYFVALD